ncbi:hypothetical protein BDN72DRAFT_845005 [Pluteus cervinus]|uniref:Uncharacterized protein n=1 Tax=Pluteus cervinus TaxID=181527 RepID=A0ACD3AKP9_9AGAR|nr:hypothetical protein BDN72DRAFT_845005 [Pluteus cervinus]
MSSNTTQSSDPSKLAGHFHSTKGSAAETLGNIAGSTNLQQSGQQERTQGQSELGAAKSSGYTEGTTDHVGGKKDSLIGGATGDQAQQTQGSARQAKGNAQQDWNTGL